MFSWGLFLLLKILLQFTSIPIKSHLIYWENTLRDESRSVKFKQTAHFKPVKCRVQELSPEFVKLCKTVQWFAQNSQQGSHETQHQLKGGQDWNPAQQRVINHSYGYSDHKDPKTQMWNGPAFTKPFKSSIKWRSHCSTTLEIRVRWQRSIPDAVPIKIKKEIHRTIYKSATCSVPHSWPDFSNGVQKKQKLACSPQPLEFQGKEYRHTLGSGDRPLGKGHNFHFST